MGLSLSRPDPDHCLDVLDDITGWRIHNEGRRAGPGCDDISMNWPV